MTKSASKVYADVAPRFWAKVNKSGPTLVDDLGPCWIWTGHRQENGYGQFGIFSRVVYAHRAAWFLEHGRWPEPCALHKCDGGAAGCVRPDHLFEGTKADNSLDFCTKGRRNGNSKLTAEKVRALREQRSKGVQLRDLAIQFGVNKATVVRILNRSIWGHVE